MIPFNDLGRLEQRLRPSLEEAALRALRSGWYVLGPELEAFEREFAAYHGRGHAVGVANGTDALELALRAAGIGPGDEVITVSHTAVATVCAIERAGAKPVLVDIDEATYTIDPRAAEAAVSPRSCALVPVHLYGQPADLTALAALAERHGLFLLEDCAQAHGARWNGRKVGTFGHAAAFSFYPTKNLGALGDGGAVVTGDAELAARLRRLRHYGQVNRYEHLERGQNSRLDEIQAALLRVKLAALDGQNEERRELARRYERALAGVATPFVRPEAEPVFHLYVARSGERDALVEELARGGIGTLIHYRVPVHLQPAYRDLGYREGSLPVTERVAREIVSLPLFVGLTEREVDEVARAVNAFSPALAGGAG